MRTALLVLLAALQDKPELGDAKGKMLPDFLLPNIEGGFGRLSDFRGKKVLLLQFASW
jgi:hypothetical protein